MRSHTFYRIVLVALFSLAWLLPALSAQGAGDCSRIFCPEVNTAPGALTASVAVETDGSWIVSNDAVETSPYTYRLRTPCEVDTAAGNACRPDDDAVCPAGADRVVMVMVLERMRLVLPDGTTEDGFVPPAGSAPGTPRGQWLPLARSCIDITALNPPPSPGEGYRYF